MANLQLGNPVSQPLGTQPTVWRATAVGTPRRLELAGTSRRAIRRRLGPGARRPHFGMKRARRGRLVRIGYGRAIGRRLATGSGRSGGGLDQGFAGGEASAAEI